LPAALKKVDDLDPALAAKNCLMSVMEVKPREHLVIICDTSLKNLGEIFEDGGKHLGLNTNLIALDDTKLRKTAPKDLISTLRTMDVDIFVNILRGMSEETPFRIDILMAENDRKVRLGHCPGLTKEMFVSGALAMTEADYKKMTKLKDKIIDACQDAERVRITTPAGTNLEMNVKDREFFTDIHVDWKTMKWMNLPVGEVMSGPHEDSLEGTLVCTHSIGGIGLLKNPTTIHVRKGRAEKVEADPAVLKKIEEALDTDKMSRYVGEFAMGINHKARLVQEFLESEKTVGTCHIAFGHNEDFPGGKNNSRNHMDFLMLEPTIKIIKKKGELFLMKGGKFQFK
jgi:leucyl aminopeptidase (aminopeptidase T)